MRKKTAGQMINDKLDNKTTSTKCLVKNSEIKISHNYGDEIEVKKYRSLNNKNGYFVMLTPTTVCW